MHHRVFDQCLQKERWNLPFSDVAVHRCFKGKGFLSVAQLLDADIRFDVCKLLFHIALLLGILENVAHIVGQHRCDLDDLAFVILIRNAMNQTQAVQEEMRFDLLLRVFQLGFLFCKLFFVDRNFQSLYFPQQFLKFTAHRLQL